MIVQNAVVCTKCDDFIFSRHIHDYVTCSCGAISVDGGQAYLRRSGDRSVAIDCSWEIEDTIYEACATAVRDAIESESNKYGIANAVMRKLREYDRIVADGEQRIMAQYNDEVMVVEADGSVNRYKKCLGTT